MLTPQEVRELSRISPWRSVASIALDWAGIVAIFVVVARHPTPLVVAAGIVLMGRQQLALATTMHEAAHFRLFQTRWLNDLAGQVLTAAPVFLALDTYRSTHLQHHRSPLTADDPDLRLIGGYPISKASFFRKLLRDVSGVSYCKFVLHFARLSLGRAARGTPGAGVVRRSARVGSGRLARVVLLIALEQAAIFAALWKAGCPWLFVTLWLVPFMTVLQVLLRIRALAEHAGFGPADDQMAISRTVLSPWQAAIFAPHNLNYHIEHHRYPSLPWFSLPRAHRLLKQRGALRDRCVASTYGEVVAALVRP